MALMTLPGGWPDTVITLRSCTPGTARSGVPGTEKELVESSSAGSKVGGEEPGPDEHDEDQQPDAGHDHGGLHVEPARGGGRSGAVSSRLMAPKAYVAGPPKSVPSRQDASRTTQISPTTQISRTTIRISPTTRNGRWARAPRPRRQPAPPASPRATKALAARTASSTPAPMARLAAMAADSEHPVPWSLPVDDTHGLEHGDPFGTGHDVMGRLGEVAPLDHHVTGPPGADLLRRLRHGLDAHEFLDRAAGEGGGLPQVGRGHQGVGEQPGA